MNRRNGSCNKMDDSFGIISVPHKNEIHKPEGT